MKTPTIPLLACLLVLSSCRLSLDREIEPGDIRGSVVVALADDTTEGAKNATIRLEGGNLVARSDANGRFVLRRVPDGRYRLRLRHDRRTASGELVTSALSLRMEVAPGDATDLGKLTVRALGALKGVVADGAAPVEATVVIDGEGLDATDDAGAYGLPRLEPGSRLVVVSRDVGNGPELFDGPTVNIASRVETERNIDVATLTPAAPGTISVRAKLLGKSDHSGIRFSARGAADPVTFPPTGADGQLVKGTLRAGVYTIVASADGYLDSRIPLTVVRGDTELPDMLLVPATCETQPSDPICASLARDDTDGDGVADYLDECPDDPLDLCAVPPAPRWGTMPTIVNATGGVSVSGEATPGATVSIYKDTTSLEVQAARCPGQFIVSTTIPVEEGDGPLTLRAFAIALPPGAITPNSVNVFRAQASLNGRLSECSSPFSITEDSVSPPKPAIVGSDPVSPSNASLTPLLSLSAPDATAVDVYAASACAGTPAGSVELTGVARAVWSATVAPNATASFSIASRDAAGNASDCSDDFAYTHDTVAPLLPTDVEVIDPGRGGEAPAVAAAVGVTFPSFASRDWKSFEFKLIRHEPPAPATEEICGAGGAIEVASSGPVGGDRFAVDYDLTGRGGNTLAACVRLTDAAGNVSDWHPVASWVIDEGAPAAPTWVTSPRVSPTREARPALPISTDPFATVSVFRSGACSAPVETTVQADADGHAVFVPLTDLVPNGDTTFSARAVDPGGNESPCSEPLVVTHDDVPPVQPTFSLDAWGSNGFVRSTGGGLGAHATGTPGSDWESWEARIVLAESAEAAWCDAPYRVLGEARATSPDPTLDLSPLLSNDDGLLLVACARALDLAGNSTPWVIVESRRIDQLPPPVPVFDSQQSSSVGASLRPPLVFSAEPGTTVELFAGAEPCAGLSVGSVVAEATTETLEPGEDATPNGTTTYWLQATDDAGNASACSARFDYLNDSLPPSVDDLFGQITSTWLVSGQYAPPTQTTEPLTWRIGVGAGEVPATIEYAWQAGTTDDCAIGTPIASLSGAGAPQAADYSGTYANLPDGTVTLCVRAVDQAGNESAWAPKLAFTVDGTPPEVTIGPLGFPSFGNPQVVVTWSATDAGSGMPTFGDAYEFGSCIAATGDCTVTSTALADSSVDVHVLNFSDCSPAKFVIRARDAAGNWSAWHERWVRPAPAPPPEIRVRPGFGALEVSFAPAEGAHTYEICAGDSSSPCSDTLSGGKFGNQTAVRWTAPPAGLTHVAVRVRGLVLSTCWGDPSPAVPAGTLAFEAGSGVEGTTGGAALGSAVVVIGDLIGLGRDQFLVGAPGANGGKGSVQGYTLDDAGGVVELPALRIDGEFAGDRFGETIAAMGDVDLDGVTDFVVGAPAFDDTAQSATDTGAVYGFSGRTLKRLWRKSFNMPNARLGASLAAGHLLRSARGAVVVGAPDAFLNATTQPYPWCGTTFASDKAGLVVVFEGSDGTVLASASYCTPNQRYGASVAVVGDLNGDGSEDFAVGSDTGGVDVDPTATTVDMGRVDLRSLYNLPNGAQVPINGGPSILGRVRSSAAGRRMGMFVAGVGDLSGDGRGEVAVGAPGASGLADLELLDTTGTVGSGGENPLETRLKPVTSALLGGASLGAGLRVAPVGDLDGDGRTDLLVGAAGSNEILVVSSAGYPTSFQVLARIVGPTPDAWSQAVSLRGAGGTGVPAILLANPAAKAGKGMIVPYRLQSPGGVFAQLGAQAPHAVGIASVAGSEAGLRIVPGDTLPLLFNRKPELATVPSAPAGWRIEGAAPLFSLAADASATIGQWVRAVSSGEDVATFVQALTGVARDGEDAAATPDFGTTVVALGDVYPNDPGCLEYAVGAPDGSGVVSLHDCNGTVVWTGTGTGGSRYGAALANLPDLDADGRTEFAIGAPGHGGGAGRVEIVRFDANGTPSRSTLDAPPGALGFGESLAADASLDLDADGCPELLVGAPDSDAGKGRVYAPCASPVEAAFGQSPSGWPLLAGDDDLGLGRSLLVIGDFDAQTGPEIAIGLRGCTSANGGFRVIHADRSALGGAICPGVNTQVGTAFSALGDVDGVPGTEFAVSAPLRGAGGVDVFRWDGAGLVLLRTIEAPAGVDRFGRSLSATSGALIGKPTEFVVGARVPQAGAGGGAVFVVDATSAHFARRVLVHPGEAGSDLGRSVALVADTGQLLAGAPSLVSGRPGRAMLTYVDPPPTFVPRPTLKAAGTPTSTTCDVIWRRSTVSQTLEFELRRLGEPWGPPPAPVRLNVLLFDVTATFEGLAPATEYSVRTRASQTGFAASPWSEAVRFTTAP